jgi:hypothetical protein
MKFRAIGLVVGTVCVLLGASEVRAGSLTAADWKAFRDHSMSQHGEAEPDELEYQLYVSGEKDEKEVPVDAAVQAFGHYFGFAQEDANAYASLIVGLVNYFETCDRQCAFRAGQPLYDEAARLLVRERSGRLLKAVVAYCRHECAFEPGAPLYDEARQQIVADTSGQLLTEVLKRIAQDETPALVRLGWDTPKALDAFRDLYLYTEKEIWLAAFLSRLPDDPVGVATLPAMHRDAGLPDMRSGALPALIDTTLARLKPTPDGLRWRKVLEGMQVGHLVERGFDAEAVRRYRALPEAMKSDLFKASADWSKEAACRSVDALESNAVALGAALWLEGQAEEARTLWQGVSVTPGFNPLRDAITPEVTDKALFELYLVGDQTAVEPHKDACGNGVFRGGSLEGNGALFALARAAPAVREVVARRLDKAGYVDMAVWLRRPQAPYIDPEAVSFLEPLSDLIAIAPDMARTWKAFAEEAKARDEALLRASNGPGHVKVAGAPAQWAEKPLPEGMSAWPEDKEGPKPPRNLSKWIGSVVRYEASGKEATVVYESAEYDLAGEIPAYGLWVALKRDGRWQTPLYLGLQTHFPYVVTPGSNLPLIDGDRLRLEVQVREIDLDTITFPPVSLDYKREAKGLYLDIPLESLRADADGDGLTDVEERRLGLDPAQGDSDGDGLIDGVDPLPLSAYSAATDPRLSQVARLVLEALAGHEARAIVIRPRPEQPADDILAAIAGGAAPKGFRQTLFVVAEKDIFAGIAGAPFRLIVYSPTDLERLGRGKAPFYPPQIINLFAAPDGSAYFVNWSAGWVGGSLIIRCQKEVCKGETVGGWIT